MRWIETTSEERDRREQETDIVERDKIKDIRWKCVSNIQD